MRRYYKEHSADSSNRALPSSKRPLGRVSKLLLLTASSHAGDAGSGNRYSRSVPRVDLEHTSQKPLLAGELVATWLERELERDFAEER